jgi:hypothetical protein
MTRKISRKKPYWTDVAKPPKQRTSTLDAESYKAKYLTSGNASHSRFMHYVRLARRDARQ